MRSGTKIVGMLDRRRDLSIAHFHQHWRGPHALEALKLAPEFIVQYVQNHSLHIPIPGFEEACDGCPVVWVHDAEAAAGMSRSDAYRTGAWIDEPRFMEFRSRGFVGHEEVVDPGPRMLRFPCSVKAMFFLKRPETLSRDDFLAGWRALPHPLVHAAPEARRYVRTIPDDPDAWFDGLEELWWRDIAGFQAAWSNRVRPEAAAALLDEAASRAMLVEENRVVWPEEGVFVAKRVNPGDAPGAD